MSYPEPIEGEPPEILYKQAIFFYDAYERAKVDIERLTTLALCLYEHVVSQESPCCACLEMIEKLFTEEIRKQFKTSIMLKEAGDDRKHVAGPGSGSKLPEPTGRIPDYTSVRGLSTIDHGRQSSPAPETPEGEFQCDKCKKYTDFIAAQLDFGYGSEHDGMRYIFCSDECLRSWMRNEPLGKIPKSAMAIVPPQPKICRTCGRIKCAYRGTKRKCKRWEPAAPQE